MRIATVRVGARCAQCPLRDPTESLSLCRLLAERRSPPAWASRQTIWAPTTAAWADAGENRAGEAASTATAPDATKPFDSVHVAIIPCSSSRVKRDLVHIATAVGRTSRESNPARSPVSPHEDLDLSAPGRRSCPVKNLADRWCPVDDPVVHPPTPHRARAAQSTLGRDTAPGGSQCRSRVQRGQ